MSKDHAMLTASNSSMISYGGGGDLSAVGCLIIAIGFIMGLTILVGGIAFIIHGIFWDISWASRFSNNYFSIHDSILGLILIPFGIIIFIVFLILALIIDDHIS